jgi:hypothetical protein
MLDTQPESKWVDIQMKLLKQRLPKGGYVLEYISRIKNILEIIKYGFTDVEQHFMTSILINGFSYQHFLETL